MSRRMLIRSSCRVLRRRTFDDIGRPFEDSRKGDADMNREFGRHIVKVHGC